MEINRVRLRGSGRIGRLNGIGTEHGPEFASVYLSGVQGPPIVVPLDDVQILPPDDCTDAMPG